MQTTLEHARKKWAEMGLSITPKCHVLFNHAIELLLLTDGFVEMGEDRIERSHQTRERDRQRLSRLRNETKMKESQAKFQHLRMNKDLREIQEKVNSHFVRNLKRENPLSESRKASRKRLRLERRIENENVIRNEPREKMMEPRERIKKELQSQRIEELESHNNT
jgi:hypothetical protein